MIFNTKSGSSYEIRGQFFRRTRGGPQDDPLAHWQPFEEYAILPDNRLLISVGDEKDTCVLTTPRVP